MPKRMSVIVFATVLLGTTALEARGAGAENSVQQAVSREQTVTFAVENMTCGLCPVTVKKAMEDVAGVKSVAIDVQAKSATVVFDPSAASAVDIAAASTNAGYPAKPARKEN